MATARPFQVQAEKTAWRWFFHVVQLASALALVLALEGPAEYSRPAIFVSLSVTTLILLFSVIVARLTVDQLVERNAMLDSAHEAHHQVQELFAMTDMLQAAEEYQDAGAVLTATSQRLLPEFSGALYVFNNSRDRLDLITKWNVGECFKPAEPLLPANCWALKRGKWHINDLETQTLCCPHHAGSVATIEVPMMARGSVFGLLVLGIESENAFNRLRDIQRVARALADSMSLALSNIALREKLRTQSLRDPLTGLYNRRYMEDALERYISLAERGGGATSVVMIDLDNFKQLNDRFGHAKGDAVLRDVAAQLMGGLRPSDVVSRYGGEELLVILPGCGVEDATLKAEQLRLRIESLSDAHETPISASFGVATVPETSTGVADVIPMADAALYAAKQAGKNCIRVAERRAARDESAPRLAFG